MEPPKLLPRRRVAVASTAVVLVALALVASWPQTPPTADATAPPADRFDLGASGSGRNGRGGEVAPSRSTGRSGTWPGTANGFDGGPFAFVGAQYGSVWKIPSGTNNSRGVGYCVMEDVGGVGVVTARPDPAAWTPRSMASAAALMSTFGGDRVVPYGIGAAGTYDVTTGEWRHPSLGADPTRRRQIAVNFGVRMFLPDQSPTGAASGRTLSRSTSIVRGTGADFAALQAGYLVAQHAATMAERQGAVGGLRLRMVWRTRDGAAPSSPGRYPLEVHITDSTGKAVGHVPLLQLSGVGIDANRSEHVTVTVDDRADDADDRARRVAAAAAGWPTWGMNVRLDRDPRFAVGAQPASADVADRHGVARFDVTVHAEAWQLAFHAQAPTSDAVLYSGSGIQGNVTWAGRPQSASVHQRGAVRDRHVSVVKTSTDPGVAVTGTVLALLDGSGAEVGRVTVGTDGRASFPPFSPARFHAPYRLRELVAAPGLTPLTGDVTIAGPLSTDPAAPTVVTVANTATAGRLRVVKRLDAADVQGTRDMSGFVFTVTQVSTGKEVGRLTTARDGSTPVLAVVRGDYRVSEVARPTWADGLGDPGPLVARFDPVRGATGANAEVVVDYVNRVPTPSIDTAARDEIDGDQTLGTDATSVVDRVTVCGAVPGTPYLVRGELVAAAGPTGIVASASFTPTAPTAAAPCHVVEVRFTVPVDSSARGGPVVAFQEVAVAASGRVVARHADPDDADQTVELLAAPPPTVTTSTSVTSLPVVVVTVPLPATTVAAAPPPPPPSPPRSSTPSPAPSPPAVALPPTGSSGAGGAARWAAALASIGAGALVATRIRHHPGRTRLGR